MSTDTFERFVTPKRFDQILQSTKNLIAIETTEVSDVVTQFRQVAVRSGQSIYLWQNDAGLLSLREGEVSVPGLKEIPDVLRHILYSTHFGVYLFNDFTELLHMPNSNILRQIARSPTANNRKIVLIGKRTKFPEGIEEHIEHMVHEIKTNGRPRLRDGKWLLA